MKKIIILVLTSILIIAGSAEKESIYASEDDSMSFNEELGTKIETPDVHKSLINICGKDSYEDNNSLDEATYLNFSDDGNQQKVDVSATLHGGIICGSDVDYYTFELNNRSSRIQFYLKDIPAGKDYDMDLFRISGDNESELVISATSYSINGSESLGQYGLESGTYALRIYSKEGYSKNYYSLEITNEPYGDRVDRGGSLSDNYDLRSDWKYSSSLDFVGDIDVFQYTPSKNTVVAVYTEGDTDVRVDIRTSAYYLVATNNDFYFDDKNADVHAFLKAGNTYTVQISGSNSRVTGDYFFTFIEDAVYDNSNYAVDKSGNELDVTYYFPYDDMRLMKHFENELNTNVSGEWYLNEVDRVYFDWLNNDFDEDDSLYDKIVTGRYMYVTHSIKDSQSGCLHKIISNIYASMSILDNLEVKC